MENKTKTEWRIKMKDNSLLGLTLFALALADVDQADSKKEKTEKAA